MGMVGIGSNRIAMLNILSKSLDLIRNSFEKGAKDEKAGFNDKLQIVQSTSAIKFYIAKSLKRGKDSSQIN